MTIFNITTAQIVYESTSVEAETREQAEAIVLNDTGALQWDYLDSAGWEITEISEAL